jgi:hypothetical protein
VQALRRPRDIAFARHGHEGAQGLGLGEGRHICQIYTFIQANSLEKSVCFGDTLQIHRRLRS